MIVKLEGAEFGRGYTAAFAERLATTLRKTGKSAEVLPEPEVAVPDVLPEPVPVAEAPKKKRAKTKPVEE
jgi:hypothetical protein